MRTELIENVLATLWGKSRFASYFFQSVTFIRHDDLPTIALAVRTGKMVLYYNESFCASLVESELLGLLIHEMMHVVLSHDHRANPEEDPYLQNLAQDMVVNSLLTEKGDRFFSRKDEYRRDGVALRLPRGLPLVPKKFYDERGIPDPSWEEVYRWLKSLPMEERTIQRTGSNSQEGFSLVGQSIADRLNESFNENGIVSFFYDSAHAITFEGIKGMVFTDDADQVVPSGVHFFQEKNDLMAQESKRNRVVAMAGKDADCTRERFFQELAGIIAAVKEQDTSDWVHLLKSVIDFSAQSSEWTYTYGRFNRRYFGSGIYAPGRIYKEQMIITAAVDVSGSMVMNPNDIGMAFGVIEDLLGKYRVNLVCLDENLFIPEMRGDQMVRSRDLSRQHLYRKGDWRHLKTGAGGTTLFAPLFNGYMKGRRETLLVITDGYIYDLEHLHRHDPTVWVIPGGREDPFTPPFGKVVRMVQ